jgi:predicted transcriptional regulator of viral defense system
MTKFDDIYEVAADNHGLVTSSEARAIGVSNNELVQYARRGSLVRVGQGVYRLARHVPTEADPYALAIALVGEGAPRKWMRTKDVRALFAKGKKIRWR